MILQPIINIAEICAQKGVQHVVLSPGSRCAHLAIAFVRHPAIKTYTISDERSAAFMALGMAQKLKKPVALLCTSGTAALNYYPAIAEAFYQQVPLVVFTADRPDEWIDQLDGQTIRQQNVYANHIKKSYHLPVDYSHQDAIWYLERSVNEAINLAVYGVRGPVHLNVPIREPFYPEIGEEMHFDHKVRIIKSYTPPQVFSEELRSEITEKLLSSSKILILVGQHIYDAELIETLELFSEKYQIPVLVDVISNMPLTHAIHHLDITLFDKTKYEALKPDCIISLGMSLLSKSVKNFIKTHRPVHHIHIQCGAEIADYTQTQETLVHMDARSFFKGLLSVDTIPAAPQYLKLWKDLELHFEEAWVRYIENVAFSEFEAVHYVLMCLPPNSLLHLANSMSVRYANYLKVGEGISVYANRGTSGIDGCTSTALGAALATKQMVTLITGDMAFLYDRNALWNNYLPANLRIVVLNNHAGGIFRIIDGPNKQPELEEYFETTQKQSAQNTAIDAGLVFIAINDRTTLLQELPQFYNESPTAKVMEISTNSIKNTEILKAFTAGFKKTSV